MRRKRNGHIYLPIFLLVATTAHAQAGRHARRLLSGAANEQTFTTLKGNTRPEANPGNDRGAVAGSTRLEHMLLQLQRPPEQEQALQQYLNELGDPTSPNFHKWLSAVEFGSRFGLAQADIDTVTAWLESHGLTVNGISPNLAVDFSGTAAQVQQAFRTQIHGLSVAGRHHFANISDPQIPTALRPAVAGIVSLNDFRPQAFGHALPEYTAGSGRYPVVPADLATIYDFNPAFTAGYSGQGQTIAVLEDSDIYSAGDWLVFRKVFGLARRFPQGQLLLEHPNSGSGTTCVDPGVNGDSLEAALDSEWASAAAPNATIVIASCQDSGATSGLFVALQNLLSGGAPPSIISISFGMSEPFLGAGGNAFVNSLYQMAVAEGVSIFVASGDSGGAGSDGGAATAFAGIAVNGYASTPYNVAVGATDFADGYRGNSDNYWSSTNDSSYGSALSYIPEIPWNATCGSELLALSKGFSTTYGSSGFCHNGGPVSVIAGGGGPSACSSGIAGPGDVVGNTCQGYAKPGWQGIVGNPADGVRDLPDVSLFGSNNVWGHYYLICFSDPNNGGRSCLGAPNTWSGYGGTSFTAPIMAGIQALVNQKTGSRWGNPNPIYYSLAATDFGPNGGGCDASAISNGSSCTFHDVTLGDNVVPCTGTNNCFIGPDPVTVGVLSLSNTAYQPAFRSSGGWDFATGVGSVDVWNLLSNWSSAAAAAPGTN